ncbi:XdhC family protein [Roseivirga thermotolerans]|uniref:XdhC family protein n=1 Tax=Roseivirga thermotolerans TaxID=1758176 RepID=UPI00273E1373|nr:XdhC family protein [Roseivirga thermotolerans]
MTDIVSRLRELVENRKRFAIARVIQTWRSSPRPVGSAMLVTEDGTMTGSVSGGCVESAVVAKALDVLKHNKAVVADFGVADDEAWEVGLSCGGAIKVLIQSGDSIDWEVILNALESNVALAWVTNLNNGYANAFYSAQDGSDEVKQALEQRQNFFADEQWFIHVFPPRLRMLLIGSAHISTELLVLAQLHDFETLLIDPRDTFVRKTERIIKPDRLEVKWPQEVLPTLKLDRDCFAVILSHDPKIDDEALKLLLPSEVRYIGALGSKKTHAKRVERLKSIGFTEADLARIDAPIGIDIGSQTPREIALSIMAAIIKTKNNGAG